MAITPEPAEVHKLFERRLLSCEQRQILRPHVHAHAHRTGIHPGPDSHFRFGLKRRLIVGAHKVVILRPLPQRDIGAFGNKRCGKKLVLDPRKLHGAWLLERLNRIPGNSEFLVLQHGQLVPPAL